MADKAQDKRDQEGNGNKEKLILLLLRKDVRKISYTVQRTVIHLGRF